MTARDDARWYLLWGYASLVVHARLRAAAVAGDRSKVLRMAALYSRARERQRDVQSRALARQLPSGVAR